MYLHFTKKTSSDELGNNENRVYNWETNEIPKLNKFYTPLGEFQKINLFVGSNNSGKSRFLRSLVKLNNVNQVYLTNCEYSISNLEQIADELHNLNLRNNYSDEAKSLVRLYSNFKNYKNNLNKDNRAGIKTLRNTVNEIKQRCVQNIKRNSGSTSLVNLNQRSLKFSTFFLTLIDNVIYQFENTPVKKIYIPILRSIHEENNLLETGTLKKIVEKKYKIKENIFTGLELYKTVHKLKNSGRDNKIKIKKFEHFLSKNFFSGNIVELNANIITQDLDFTIHEVEHPIYDLGDGIQALIIILFPIFTSEKNDWFFIEEPETNLHPGLQRIFIETLLNDEYLNSKNLKYFFTTHSNHLLDTSIKTNNISIFQFEEKENNNFFIKTNARPNKEVLDLLGVNTSSVFLANTSLWVEGPTDRKYISKFLKLYCEEKGKQPLKEDIDFAFFEYGGNLIEHYLFNEKEEFDDQEIRDKINSFSLSNKIYLLADNDNVIATSKKGIRRKTFEKLSSENKNFAYQNTIVTEIENLLPKKIIQDFMSELITDEPSRERAKKIRFERKDYKNVRLGEFYTEKFKNSINSKYLKKFKSESGTLKNNYKIKLARFVIDSDYKYSDLIEDNKELETIIERLYSYIAN